MEQKNKFLEGRREGVTVNAGRYRRIWVGIMVLLALFCTACGEEGSERERGIEGYVYRPELLFSFQEQAPRIWKMKVWGGSLYYTWKSTLYRLSVGDGIEFSESSAVLEDPPGGLLDYVTGPDQELYYVAGVERSWDDKTTPPGCTLIKRQEDGRTVYNRFFPDAAVSGEECLAVNGDGWVFLLLEDEICCVDPEGEVSGSIGTGEVRAPGMEESLLRGADGRVYYCVKTGSYYYSFYEISGKNSFQLVKLEGPPEKEIMDVYSSEYGLLCDTREGILYQCRGDGSGWDMLMKWGDTDLYHPTSDSNLIAQVDGERILTCLAAVNGREMTEEMSLLTRTPVSELPEKEELVMASFSSLPEVLQVVSEFNRTSSRYHITVEFYRWEELETKLNSRLVSSNPPDMVDLTQMDILNYAEKQIFEDLTSYLEQSSLLDREDFLENLLEGYTVDGKLVCIPKSFGIYVTMGKSSLVGEEPGWTVEEFMEAAERNPGLKLTDYYSTEELLRNLFRQYLCSHYIDWDTGECRFDSEEFCQFLEWVKAVDSGNITEDNTTGDNYRMEESLVTRKQIMEVAQSTMMEVLYGEKFTFKGDPTEDGHAFYPVVPQDAVGIVSGSKHKEGAWEFVEYFLSRDVMVSSGVPSRRDILMKVLEEEMTPEYWLTEEGEVMTWNGEPRLDMKFGYVCGQEIIPYYYMTQEQADAFLNVLSALDFTPEGGVRKEIVEIIIEESRSCLGGDRSVEEVARYIQNRVWTLVQEDR